MWVKFDTLLWKIREDDLAGANPETVRKYSWSWSPVWVIVPTWPWDIYIDTASWWAWINADGTVDWRREYNYTMDV